MQLDRTVFKQQTHAEAADHQSTYRQMSVKERSDAFLYLMQVNFGFLDRPWPKMDKTHFSKRSRR